MSTDLTTQKLDNSVLAVIGNSALQGFEKAHTVSNAIVELKNLLTPEYMKPIMALQGNKLGFKSDKDKTGGYSVDIVKNCLIEAVLMGVQPTGNHFNIISGQTYLTKEGCGYLLNNFKGLKYNIVCGLPQINPDKSGASVEVNISWTLNGQSYEKTVPIPIKTDSYTSVDAVIGKATRKGRAWLLSTISGVEITDGETTDAEVRVMSSTPLIDADDLLLLFETKKELLTDKEVTAIDRVLKNKEVNSYKKVKDLLDSKEEK